jgi:hypothetical protein
MNNIKTTIFICMFLVNFHLATFAQRANEIMVKGTSFEMNGEPFEYTGLSFFNALYNPEFNKNRETRQKYIKLFKENGISVLRIWCQWDNGTGFVDSGPTQTIYNQDGSLKPELVALMKQILKDADKQGMVILFVLFARESWNANIRLSDQASETAIKNITKELLPNRNMAFQVWNEFNYRTIDYFNIIKQIDPARLVTNSPGYGGDLGTDEENRKMDFLSPHTSRTDDRHWEVAAIEIGQLIQKFRKPVVDDEPARRGTSQYGGPKSPTSPNDHILQMYNVWKAGGYVIYHHDMFQTGYGSEAVPANGIPAPGFSTYHDQVFDFLKNKSRYLKQIR